MRQEQRLPPFATRTAQILHDTGDMGWSYRGYPTGTRDAF